MTDIVTDKPRNPSALHAITALAVNRVQAQVRGGLAPWQLQRVKTYIAAHITTNIRISDLAACVRLSDSYFFQAFRRSFGQSPHGYVTACRIGCAQEMMIRTTLPLTQIALDCGLADQPHLTRLFRHHVGTSPALWRKVHQAPAHRKIAAGPASLPAAY
jgi:AraC family transcriptional regulator